MYLLKMIKFIFMLVILCCISQHTNAKCKVIKYVYQRDMSEHCRRRVMPSVFLGEHVVESNSQILHFSKLEVPYSCFISIRTESGGNIILVIKTDELSLICGKDRTVESPVKVFGMGETFGGYWGPLPDSILSTSTPQVEKFYTIKTTKEDPILDEDNNLSQDELTDGNEDVSEHGVTAPQEAQKPPVDTRDYVRQMVPIVNITGRLVKTDKEPVRAFAVDDTFDLFYNVKREPGKKYDSTVVPLMQFSMAGQSDGRRAGGESNGTTPEPRFDFEFDFGGLTLDPRLIFPMSGGKPAVPGRKYRPLANRRLNFKKNQGRLFSAKDSPNLSKKHLINNKLNESWSYIEGLLKNASGNNLEQDEKENQSENKRFSALLERVADWQHNYSAYLAPNLTLSNPLFLESLHKGNLNFDSSKSSTLITSYHTYKVLTKTNINQLSTKASSEIIKETSTFIDMHANTKSSRLIKVSAGTLSTSSTFGTSTKTSSEATEVTSGITAKITEVTRNTLQKLNDFATGVTTQMLGLGSKITEKIVSPRDSVSTITPGDVWSKSKINVKTKTTLTQKATTEWPTIKSSPLTISSMIGTMADHASWDNVVQVAPKIAGILNTTKSIEKTHYPKTARRHKRQHRRRRRRKRSIQAIPIEPARPHNLTTDPDVITTPEAMYNFVDMQDFARLIELQDDEVVGLCENPPGEAPPACLSLRQAVVSALLCSGLNGIQGHIALRYMRRFVGATMFDVCANQDHTPQHVLFLNTSRIVLALNNFTLKTMTVIATPARWLPYSGQRCNSNSLECQVAGKRVCVSKLTACDGVPNCGAQDIYDEDRLLCGLHDGEHNVYLAAFTFLAVLLTMLYTVHYWLRRCVPKVSEAFFIYTDGTENILYLDSIMRSPLENETGKTYRGNYLDEVLGIPHDTGQKKKGLLRRIFGFCCRKKKELDDFEMVDMDLIDGFHRAEHKFSFPEIEISNLTNPQRTEAAVQTGSSLEMPHLSDKESKIFFESTSASEARDRLPSIDPRAGFRDVRLHYGDEEETERRCSENSELSVLKFLREAKITATQSQRVPIFKDDPERETELKNTMYDRSLLTIDQESLDIKPFSPFRELPQRTPFGSNIPLVIQEPLVEPPASLPSENPRRIRFNEALTSIPQEEDVDNLRPERSQMLAQEEFVPDTPLPGSSRDFRRFWTSNKSKKEKPKQRKHLPMQ